MFLRTFLLLAALSFFEFTAMAEEFRIYGGSRVSEDLLVVEATSSEDGISFALEHRIGLGFATGAISRHPDKPIAWIAALKPDDGDDRTAQAVAVDLTDQIPTPQRFQMKHGSAWMTTDRTGDFLLSVFYFGGQVDVYRLDEAGLPSQHVAQLDESLPFAHCVHPSPDNRFLYIPWVKENNALRQFEFDAGTGGITPLEPKEVPVPDGLGPRHLVYHPTLPIVYFSNEQDLGASVFEMADTGHLTLRQVCEAAPGEPKDGVTSSDISITPDGRFLFVGIRGHERDFDWIARYSVDAEGTLDLLGLTPADKIPWGFTFSPDGQFLLVTAFEGATLTAYCIEDDGQLEVAGKLTWDAQISDLLAVPRG